MGVKLNKFSEEDSFGPVTKLSRTVKTPVPSTDEYGSGNGSEKNRMVVYTTGEYRIKVSKISNRGWSVKRYDGDDLDKMEPGNYFEDEAAAHDRARELVEEVADE